jgi:hypothetical protein
MVHIIYGLVCRENVVGDEVFRIVKKLKTTVLEEPGSNIDFSWSIL